MGEFVTLTCPACGAKLQVTEDLERFACASCGNEHLIRRSGGLVSLAPLAEGLKGVERATDRTASEMAIKRLQTEIDEQAKALAALKDVGMGSSCGSIALGIPSTVALCWILWQFVEVAEPLRTGLTILPVLVWIGIFIQTLREDKRGHANYLKSKAELTRQIEEDKTQLEWHRQNLKR